jgi:hypothetical protein
MPKTGSDLQADPQAERPMSARSARLLALLVRAGGGWASSAQPMWTMLVVAAALASAATLSTYLPRPGAGRRLDVGCTPCAAVAAVSVVVAAGVLGSSSHDVPTAIIALGVAGFGLRQRLTDPSTCPAPNRRP